MSDWEQTRWWRVVYRFDSDAGWRVWCESSDEEEVRRSLKSCPGGGQVQNLYQRTECEWRST